MLVHHRTGLLGTGSRNIGNPMLAMDKRQELPSISTAFAEFFPNHKANTAPTTPPGEYAVRSPSLKRKRSDPGDIIEESSYWQTRPPLSTSRTTWPEPARSYPLDGESVYKSPRYSRQREDSVQDLRTNNPSYSKSSYSPTLPGRDSVYRRGSPRDEVKRPASASAVGGHAASDLPLTSNARESQSQSQQHRLLPPITGLDQPPSASKPETWGGTWQQDPRPSLPAAIEPRTHYHALDREQKNTLDPKQEQRGVKRDRSPAPERPLSNIKTPRRDTYNDRYHYEASPYHRMPEPLSPVNINDRPRTMQRMQPMQAPPPAWDPSPSSQQTSPTDPSPSSARPHLDAHPRYSWDSSLYENMRSVRKRRGNLPKESTALLNDWYNQHASYPYPKEAEKQELQQRTGLHMSQISNWFINARRRRRPSSSSRTAEGLPRTLAFDFSRKE